MEVCWRMARVLLTHQRKHYRPQTGRLAKEMESGLASTAPVGMYLMKGKHIS